MTADCEQKVRPFWLSWYHDGEVLGPFELHTPWWVSGYRGYDETICAAVLAADEEAAREIVVGAYETWPKNGIEFRFVTLQEPGWSPFGDRFPGAEWMQWPAAGDPW
jgi:hypothetical protein